MLGLLSFTCPPILGLRGKNAVGSFLPFISLNDLLLDFSSEHVLLISSHVFNIEGVNEGCSSPKLSI